jgi:hypothetical protein
MLTAPRLVLLGCLLALVIAAPAGAALKIDSDTTSAKLAVSADGRAQVTWTKGGKKRTAVVSGTSVRYAGAIAKTSKAVSVTPTVPFAIVQLQLPNGMQFALQRVRRLGQFGKLGPEELYLARWRGEPTALTLTEQGGRICGTVSYHDNPVFGSEHTASGNPLDALGRNIYLDSLRPTGWYRMLGVLARPLGYAFLVRDEWVGTRYRALVVGPNSSGDLAPVASAETPAGEVGTCPFAAGTYKGE